MEGNIEVAVEKIASFLEKIAVKIGVAADTVWPWIVKQQVIEGASVLIALVICAALSVLSYNKFAKYAFMDTVRKNDEDWDTHRNRKSKAEAFSIVWMVFGGCVAFGLVVALLSSFTGIQQLINPEYFALMDLISAAK